MKIGGSAHLTTALVVLAVVLSPFIALAGDGRPGPFIPIDLGTLGGVFSSASAINANGQVVGGSQTADGTYHAFSWTAAGGMVDLGTLSGSSSDAIAIYGSGRGVG